MFTLFFNYTLFSFVHALQQLWFRQVCTTKLATVGGMGLHHAYSCTCTRNVCCIGNSCKTLIGVHEMHGRMHPN